MKVKSDKSTVKITAGCGVLAAVAVILQYIEISIPLVPSFLKLDFSDIPELLGAFAYGPVFGIVIAFVKNLIHMAVSQSGFVGELSNLILGAVFSFTAGVIYKLNKTKKNAIISGITGALVGSAVSVPVNYFIIYPMYYSILNFPEKAVLSLYQLILPSITTIPQALLIFNVPFTFVKFIISLVISVFVYKPVRKILK